MCEASVMLKSISIGDKGVELFADGNTLTIRDARTGEDFAVLVWEYNGPGVYLRPLEQGTGPKLDNDAAWVWTSDTAE